MNTGLRRIIKNNGKGKCELSYHICSFQYSANRYLLSIYYYSGTVLGMENVMVCKTKYMLPGRGEIWGKQIF